MSVPLVEGGRASPPIWLIGEVFGFETNLNEGGALRLWAGPRIGLCGAVASRRPLGWCAGCSVARAARDLHLTIALGCVLAGILGNLYDRLGLHGLTWAEGVRGHDAGERVYAVRDWLHFKIDAIGFDWPIFNLADSCLVCGAILLIWHAFRRHD